MAQRLMSTGPAREANGPTWPHTKRPAEQREIDSNMLLWLWPEYQNHRATSGQQQPENA
ncbi:hypothetical protein DAPPUDRAFT_233037 [Daphnia pulex]|uniref:Uncharacterized protein n=1 Tax=Daphnia pulex TaxID=6669 RepID=E9FT10_DAPPU|nr:hypothetical protein DAPPUDRAFT_233037 [Daphnia pulex]|eukprot:EFX89288.1 hypothetical protein DAPPUDRAFT_233037 [Daphnia pulex]